MPQTKKTKKKKKKFYDVQCGLAECRLCQRHEPNYLSADVECRNTDVFGPHLILPDTNCMHCNNVSYANELTVTAVVRLFWIYWSHDAFMHLWFARDIWRYRNVFWLIDWLMTVLSFSAQLSPNSNWLDSTRSTTRHVRRVETMHFGCVDIVEQHSYSNVMVAGTRYRIHLCTNRLIRYHAALWWR